MGRHGLEQKLFDTGAHLPNGLIYRPDFLTHAEEDILLAHIENLPLKHPIYDDEYEAKRRVKGFGWKYDFEKKKLIPGAPLPSFLAIHARKIAKWMDIPSSRVVHALVTEYTPGTAIGWHTDTEEFEHVVGISLSGWARMRFRKTNFRSLNRTRKSQILGTKDRKSEPYKNMVSGFRDASNNVDEASRCDLELEPRSCYIMQGDVRWHWQHSVAPTKILRYSITFRTLP